MSQISLPPQAKQALWKALKAGVQTEFPTSKQGTPQGGCISPLLAIRGLKVKEAKTKLVASTEGFDFLGWHFRVKGNGKFISTPSDKNYSRIQENIKTTLKNSKFKLEARINKVCLIVRGWRNYHKHCDMNNHNLWFIRYWSWKFICQQGRFNRRETDIQIDRAFPSVSWSVNKFVNVTGTKSPFDGNLTYWSQRKSKQYN